MTSYSIGEIRIGSNGVFQYYDGKGWTTVSFTNKVSKTIRLNDMKHHYTASVDLYPEIRKAITENEMLSDLYNDVITAMDKLEAGMSLCDKEDEK